MQNRILKIAGAAVFGLAIGLPAIAYGQTDVRISWYNDGNEGEVLRDLLDRFEADNPDITVTIDTVPYSAILETLPVQLAAGEGPDMARVTDLGGLSKFYLDLTPHLSDNAYWQASFGPFLQWLRTPEEVNNEVHGFPTQLTLTGPFINKTLFDQAEVAVPEAGATWDDWAAASKAVADKLDIPIPIAMDRSGHRFAGPAISMGAKVFDADGEPALVDDGFKAMAAKIVDWHQTGVMSQELWGSVSGSSYVGANEEFANAQVVMYMSGSWQISQFNDTIGDAFDWVAVPQPCGPAACTGMPGGAALVAIGDTEHPAEVARVMEFLASEDILGEFSARTLFIPAHLGLAEKGVDFQTDAPLAKAALDTFLSHIPKLDQTAFDYQGYAFNRLMFNATISRLGQAVVGELTLDEAYERVATDIEADLAEQRR